MSGHESASSGSRSLCEMLLQEINALRPGVVRSESNDTCAIYLPGNNQFAHVYHSKKRPIVKVYFRGDAEMMPAPIPESAHVEKRAKFAGPWSKEFPFFLKLIETDQVSSVAKILSEYSFPFSIPKKTRGKVSYRPINCLAEEIQDHTKFSEGSVQRIVVNRFERDLKARAACIAHFGSVCYIFKFDFVAIYGDFMGDFIHVHHLKPIASVGSTYEVDPVRDLRPVCPNCHAVLHRKDPPYKIREVKDFIRTRKPLINHPLGDSERLGGVDDAGPE